MKPLIFIAAIALVGCGPSASQIEADRQLDSLDRYMRYKENSFRYQAAGAPITDEKVDSMWNYSESKRPK